MLVHYIIMEKHVVFLQATTKFTNCVVANNTGYATLKMFEFILYNHGCYYTSLQQQFYIQQYNNITYENCVFVDNYYIISMIQIGLCLICQHNFKYNRLQFWQE